MNKANTISIIILILMSCCVNGKQSDDCGDDFITVDVLKSYPQKKLILQNFFDVEYIPLETTDGFYNDGQVRFIDKDILILRNRKADEDILIYDRHTGKALHKINHRGIGPEDYTVAQRVVYDDESKEMFVLDHFQRKILVYDLDGKFKRRLSNPNKAYYTFINNINQEYLLCANEGSLNSDGPAFHVISKQDGSLIHQIDIPFEKVLPFSIPASDGSLRMLEPVFGVIPLKDRFIISPISSDTVYSYFPNQVLKPLIARTPSIQTMNPMVFLLPMAINDHYYFMQTAKIVPRSEGELPRKNLVYDRKEKAIYEYKLCNDDISDKSNDVFVIGHSSEIVFWYRYEASFLIENLGILKGKLKEIAAGLDEEDNPVIVLVKNKK